MLVEAETQPVAQPHSPQKVYEWCRPRSQSHRNTVFLMGGFCLSRERLCILTEPLGYMRKRVCADWEQQVSGQLVEFHFLLISGPHSDAEWGLLAPQD